MGGIKKALSPLHAMYSYTDASVWLINSLYVPADNIHVYASIYTLNGTLLSSKDKGNIAIDADGTMNLFSLPMNENGFFFIHLRTVNSTTGNEIEDSFYWYNSNADILDWADSNFYLTPCSTYADLTALSNLPEISSEELQASCSEESTAATGDLRMLRDDGSVIAPILWDDNMFTLLPQTQKSISV